MTCSYAEEAEDGITKCFIKSCYFSTGSSSVPMTPTSSSSSNSEECTKNSSPTTQVSVSSVSVDPQGFLYFVTIYSIVKKKGIFISSKSKWKISLGDASVTIIICNFFFLFNKNEAKQKKTTTKKNSCFISQTALKVFYDPLINDDNRDSSILSQCLNTWWSLKAEILHLRCQILPGRKTLQLYHSWSPF